MNEKESRKPFRRVLLVLPDGMSGLSYIFPLIPIALESIESYIQDAVDEVLIYDQFMDKKPFRKILIDFNPDIVGFSMSATEHSSGAVLMKFVRHYNKEIPIIVGGFHPTGDPELLLNTLECDAVCRGEGEGVMMDLVIGTPWNKIDGLSYKDKGKIIHNKNRQPINDLDSIPLPDRRLRKERGYHYTYAQVVNREYDVIDFGRGCFGQCAFCCEPYFSRGMQRYRSPEKTMKDIKTIWKFYGKRPLFILITDPHIMGQFRKIDRLADLLIDENLDIKFQVMSRTESIVKRPATVEKMIRAGMISWELGIESFIQEDLNLSGKNTPMEVQKEAVDILRNLGGITVGTFVVGLPDHTKSIIKQFPTFAKEIGISSAVFGIATPFPGTKFWDDLSSNGIIFEKNWSRFDENHSVFHHPTLLPKEIEGLRNWCMTKFWNIDTLIDEFRVAYHRVGKYRPVYKVSLREFIIKTSRRLKVRDHIKKDLDKYTPEDRKIFFKNIIDAWVDTRIKQYFNKYPIWTIIDTRQFGRMFGGRRIQVIIEDREERKCLLALLITVRDVGIENISISKMPTPDCDLTIRSDITILSDSNNTFISTLKNIRKVKISGIRLFLKMLLYGMKELISGIINRNPIGD